MLNEITIKNVAVIEEATAIFGDGFNVLTGETGAGKSILIDSINAILGNRTSKDIVRNGALKASIWASFSNIPATTKALLEESGYTSEDELLLSREITAEGKSTCRINGAPATAAVLREICGGLINIHGQHDNQSLMNPAKHITILDSYAQNESLLQQYQEQYRTLVAISKELNSLSMDEDEKKRRLELLKYEVNEIDSAQLSENEEEELTNRRNLIRNAQTILNGISVAYQALSGGDEEPGANILLGDAANEIAAAARYSEDLVEYADTLQEMFYNATEIASDLQKRLDDFGFDPRELDDIEIRLDTIYKLKQKYGGSIESVIRYGQKAQQQLDDITFSSEKTAKLEAQKKDAFDKTIQLAEALTQSRQQAFDKLNAQLKAALAFLNMPGIIMDLAITPVRPGPLGKDEIEFLISTNPGETPKPMAKIASGGELSRIMLALKSALADRDDTPTVIYDEIDTGISGMAAGRIGAMLKDTSTGRQVICVTHTAQVAAFATKHLLIEKNVKDGRTYTGIRSLTQEERIDELARIISGDRVTDLAKQNAAEMLELAHQNQ